MRRATVSFGLIIAALAAAFVAVPAQDAAAASGFDPGYIISDQQFWNHTSMTEADIQAFLDVKGKNCVPIDGPCLKNFAMDTESKDAGPRCTEGYAGSPGTELESAARIIYKVAQSCKVNPQVILVTLQKEQGLVTATKGRALRIYDRAMGYGCPDNASGACDPGYGGFQNQVMNGAAVFRRYAQDPSRGYRAGVVNDVRFSPNAACGSSPVFIVNQATAGLYNYTPYQPNAASLAAGYGTGDACSSYGNRNFFNYFNDWFPSNNVFPIGVLDVASQAKGVVTLSGWALDPDSMDPIGIRISVNGAQQVIVANASRPDVGAATGKGDLHGFGITLQIGFGRTTVCVDAIDVSVSGSTSLGCRVYDRPQSYPLSVLDGVSVTDGQIQAFGWGFDPDVSTPITMILTVNGTELTRGVTDVPRADVNAAMPASNATPGFTLKATMPAVQGASICVLWLDANTNEVGVAGCRFHRNADALGVLDGANVTEGGLRVDGWAYDPDSPRPIAVDVYLDGVGVRIPTDVARPDVAQSQRGANGTAGFSRVLPLAGVGARQVCVYAIDAGNYPNYQFGCRVFVNYPPSGIVDAVTATPGGIEVSGWAVDRDTRSPRALDVTVGTQVTSITTSTPRADVAAGVPGGGNNDGFSAKVPLPAGVKGPVSVCVSVRDTSSTVKVALGCTTVTIP